MLRRRLNRFVLFVFFTMDTDGNELYLKRCRVLLHGIKPEALEVLKELVDYGLPVFQWRDRVTMAPLAEDARVLCLMAAVRDGELGLVKLIERMRADAGAAESK